MKKKEWKRRCKALERVNASLTASNDDLWAELQEWRHGWRVAEPSVFGPMQPEPEERVCSGIAWDVCRRWMTLDTEEPFPCATMTGCDSPAMWSNWCQFMFAGFDANDRHTRPCGVMT